MNLSLTRKAKRKHILEHRGERDAEGKEDGRARGVKSLYTRKEGEGKGY